MIKYDKKLLDEVIEIAVLAGREIMEIYARDFAVEYKDDKSPLTEADKHSNDVIIAGLQKLDRQYPILSEETKAVDYSVRKDWGIFWLVDPIDGTKEFIKKNGEFTVNIALIENGVPVLGVVYVPALGVTYYGMKGYGAFRALGEKTEKLPLMTNKPEESGVLRIVASKSHMNEETEAFIKKVSGMYGDARTELVSKGSSLKLCMVAEGAADIYPRVAPTMEWDTAAAQAVVEAAGKNVYDFTSFSGAFVLPVNKDNNVLKLIYNKENLLNPYFVVL